MADEVRTVTGTVAADDLGRVLMHEHIRIQYPGETLDPDWSWDRADCVARAVDRLQAVADHGVRTIVDPCPIELGRDPELMAEVSSRSGTNIICSTGFYFEHDAIGIPFYWRARTAREVADFYLSEIHDGIGSTGIRPGVIKIASGDPPGPQDRKVIAGAALAAKESGLALVSHCEHSKGGHVQQDVLEQHGADLTRAMIGHQDEETDAAKLIAIAQRGSTVGIDRIGTILATPENRADNVAALVAAGHAERVCLAHDTSCCFHAVKFPYPLPEGSPDDLADQLHPVFTQQVTRPYTELFEDFLPMLAERDVSEEDVEKMLKTNPRRILTGSAS